jgi:hypothetical protein
MTIVEQMDYLRKNGAFTACAGCGAWIDARTDGIIAIRFSLLHLSKCPVTGRAEHPVRILARGPEASRLTECHRWVPLPWPPTNECSSDKVEVPLRFHIATEKDLPGVWVMSNSRGGPDYTIAFAADGRSTLDFWFLGDYCGREEFRWELRSSGKLLLRPHSHYWRCSDFKCEVAKSGDHVGRRPDRLRNTALNSPLLIQEFRRSSESIRDCMRRKPKDG